MIKTIMVVDDDPNLTYVVKRGLEKLDPDFSVVCVDSGENCLSLLENNHIPDIILLDIVMPGMSGWGTFERLKENLSWRDIPVVFLTARTDRMAKEAGGFLGDDYIEKPFEITDLKERIDKVLEKLNNKLGES